jgi:hypothetical protein
MNSPAIFPYVQTNPLMGAVGMRPLLPFKLQFGNNSIQAMGLVDSGATINVLPYHIGLQLGADWSRMPMLPPLGGIFVNTAVRLILVEVEIASFPVVILSFAWSQDPNAPLLLGEFDFFDHFDVCFHRSQLYFEVQPNP